MPSIQLGDYPTDDAPVPEPEPKPAFTIVTSPTSFVTKYVRFMAMVSDAPPQANELMAVGTLSALAGPNPRIPLATSIAGQQLNRWGGYIVDSTIGRKSTVIDYGRNVIVEVLGREAVFEWEGSPQGLVQRLQDRDGQAAIFVRDEFSGLLAQMTEADT